ncbi:unnamed protein product [Angiostrongylus costaricensis]|uniref:Uncharacterized protein n=1 Tax=Angiostrongylus costaricensis TaxID=334426 RepID=A0A158PF29_ANGCS|nr:unnamed protein product [Angiostrongylus costaricensis]
MSDYLGWSERQPPVGTKTSQFKEDFIQGGPVTHSYEKYVKNIFHPMNRMKRDTSQMIADNGLSASSMLKMERTLGRYAIDDSLDVIDDDNHVFMKSPLDSLYSELGVKSPEVSHEHYRQYTVYIPKQSSEYFAISHGGYRRPERSQVRIAICTRSFLLAYYFSWHRSKLRYFFQSSWCYSSFRERGDEEYAKSNHKTLIDYKEFDSSPLSPYLYRDHPYVRTQDTRILGSNFVQLTSRPKDRFLEKIDQTLAEVRAMPRYD